MLPLTQSWNHREFCNCCFPTPFNAKLDSLLWQSWGTIFHRYSWGTQCNLCSLSEALFEQIHRCWSLLAVIPEDLRPISSPPVRLPKYASPHFLPEHQEGWPAWRRVFGRLMRRVGSKDHCLISWVISKIYRSCMLEGLGFMVRFRKSVVTHFFSSPFFRCTAACLICVSSLWGTIKSLATFQPA